MSEAKVFLAGAAFGVVMTVFALYAIMQPIGY